jgi:hypothetical protein
MAATTFRRPLTPATNDAARPLAWRADHREVALRLSLAVAGATPVTLIAATAFGVADLRSLAAHVLVPVLAATALLVAGHRRAATVVLVAVVAGPIATLAYDAFRFAFLASGLMHGDPIPHIGTALHLEPAWLVGYGWRYLANGTGLAVAFIALGFRGVRAGVAYGLVVCAGLLVVLIVSPHGTQMLFTLTPATVVMALGGHAIYGALLALIADRLVPGDLWPAETMRSGHRVPAAYVTWQMFPGSSGARSDENNEPERDPAGGDDGCRSLSRPSCQLRVTPMQLQDVECHPVGFGGGPKIRSDIVVRHGDRLAQPVGGGERLDHGSGQGPPLGTVASLQERHRPGHVSEAQDLDRGGQSDELCPKTRLHVLRQKGDRTRQLADDGRIGEGRAQSEQPQAGGRDSVRREPIEGLITVTDEDVAQ